LAGPFIFPIQESLGMSAESVERWGIGRLGRLAASSLLLLHIFAMFLSPFHFNTIPPGGNPAPDAELVMPWLRPYINFMFLNHGYAFFAPNPPAANHLMRASLDTGDDRPPTAITFPDRALHRPRLMYHRHFMLTEFLHGAYPDPLPDEPDAESRARHAEALANYFRIRASFENHLRVAYGVPAASITRVEHRMIPYDVLLRERPSLTDPRSYSDLDDVPVSPMGSGGTSQ
jgi:hypothetical protein